MKGHWGRSNEHRPANREEHRRIARFADCKLHPGLLLRDVQNASHIFCTRFYWHFGVFSDLGLSTLTVREVARDKSLAEKYLGNIAVMKLIFEERKDEGKSKRYIFKLKRT